MTTDGTRIAASAVARPLEPTPVMPAEPTSTSARDSVIEVNLRRPDVAAFWAWFWPGAGHLYQRRYAKGMLFMVCILSTYFYGLALGGGHSVYASFRENDRRWQYICQVGVGLPALPAIVQSYRVLKLGKQPLIGDIMAPPSSVNPDALDELALWHQRYPFEMATLYTMIAGLLNVLAIYDAYAGPMTAPPEEDKKKKKPPPKEEPGLQEVPESRPP